jgi:hypothetical protein
MEIKMEREPIRQFQMIKPLDQFINSRDPFYIKGGNISDLFRQFIIERFDEAIYDPLEYSILGIYYIYNEAFSENLNNKKYFSPWWEEKIISDLFIYIYPDDLIDWRDWHDEDNNITQCFINLNNKALFNLRKIREEYYIAGLETENQIAMLQGTGITTPIEYLLKKQIERFIQIIEFLDDSIVRIIRKHRETEPEWFDIHRANNPWIGKV